MRVRATARAVVGLMVLFWQLNTTLSAAEKLSKGPREDRWKQKTTGLVFSPGSISKKSPELWPNPDQRQLKTSTTGYFYSYSYEKQKNPMYRSQNRLKKYFISPMKVEKIEFLSPDG